MTWVKVNGTRKCVRVRAYTGVCARVSVCVCVWLPAMVCCSPLPRRSCVNYMDISGLCGATTEPEWIKCEHGEPLDKQPCNQLRKHRCVTASPLHRFVAAKQQKEKALGEQSVAALCVSGRQSSARREWLHLRAATVTLIPVWKSKLARWNRRLFL